MKKFETYFVIQNRKVHYIRQKEFLKNVYSEFKEGDRGKVVFEQLYKKRSDQQNKYYWGGILPILLAEINEQGNNMNTDELHELLKDKFCPKREIHNADGEVINAPGSTAVLTTTEMCEYVEEVRKWAAEFWGCNIPDANEQTEVIFNSKKQ